MSKFPTAGRGRGMILHCLEPPATSSEESPVTSKSQPSTLMDSSFGTATGSPVISGGRGNRMFDQISISSKSSSQATVRLKEIIQLFILTKQFFQPDLPPTLPVAPAAPVVGGRAKLIHYLKNLEISRPTTTQEDNEDAQACGDGIVRPAEVVLPEQSEEKDPEIVMKRGKAGN